MGDDLRTTLPELINQKSARNVLGGTRGCPCLIRRGHLRHLQRRKKYGRKGARSGHDWTKEGCMEN